MTGDRHRQQPQLLWEHLIAAQLSPQKPSATPFSPPHCSPGLHSAAGKEARQAPCLQRGGFLTHTLPVPALLILPMRGVDSATFSPLEGWRRIRAGDGVGWSGEAGPV